MSVFVRQREGALGDDDSADMDGENGRGFEEYEWAGQKRIRATALLEGGFRGTYTDTHTQLALFSTASYFTLPLTQGCLRILWISSLFSGGGVCVPHHDVDV